MSQNLAIPNADNKVVLTFAGAFLSTATDISVLFGAESYTLLLNPTIVFVDSDTQLSIDLSATAEVGRIFATIKRFDSGSTNGTDITSQELGNLGQIIVAIGTQLIIEDGSIVPNANSIATDAKMKAYASLRGLAVPDTQPERESLLILGMDFLKSIENRQKGTRTDVDQTLPEPRQNVWLYGQIIDQNTIPIEYENAQIEAAIAAKDMVLLTNSTNQNVSSEKIETLQVSYFEGGSWDVARLDRVFAALNPLLSSNGTGFGRTARTL